MRTPHGFTREEAARRDRDALEMQSQRTLQIAHALLGVLQPFDSVAGNGLEVRHLMLQRAEFLGANRAFFLLAAQR